MGSYAIIGIAKLKSAANIRGVLDHMARSRETLNANGRENDVLIQPPPLASIMERIQSYLPRKNAVYCYDFLLTASPQFFQGKTEAEIRAWERDSLAWSQKVFGSDNVIGAICHRDETTPHIQLLIVPEKDGKLNARAFTGGREKLRGLWTSYAQAMQKWGLQRGKLYSPAEHKAIKDYYADVNRSAAIAARAKVKPGQLPDPTIKDRVSPQEYAARLINYAVGKLQKQNANLKTGLDSAKKENETLTAAAANDRKLFLMLKENPGAFRELQAALQREKDGRKADKKKYERLVRAIRDFFRQNIDPRSPYRKPESLGALTTFPELQDDLRIDLTPDPKPKRGSVIEM